MKVSVTPTTAFKRDLKNLSSEARDEVIAALSSFLEDPHKKSLNFERVRNRRDYWTIRSSYSVRILLREAEPKGHFEIVAVGNHDLVYWSFFKK